MTEIMQATTVQNLRKTRNVNKEQYHSNAKKLKRYLGQLTYAKAQCDARLRSLGYPGFEEYDSTSSDNEKKVTTQLPPYTVKHFWLRQCYIINCPELDNQPFLF